MQKRKLSVLSETFGVCRLSPDGDIPGWALSGGFFSVTKTQEELSVVCAQAAIPEGTQCEANWRALKVEGPLDFSLTGILYGLSKALAQNKISLFAVSTYDTDYILVKNENLDKAIEAFKNEGCEVIKQLDIL